MIATLTEQRCHVALTVHRQIRILARVGFHIALIEHAVIVIASRAGIVHHTCEVGAQNFAIGFSSVGCFFNILSIFLPSTEEEYRGVARGISCIAVDGVEEVGSPGIGQVRALLQAYNRVLVLARHLDEVGGGGGVLHEVSRVARPTASTFSASL